MMRKIIPLTALVLGLSGGVVLADRDHGRGGERHSAPQNHVVVRGDAHASGAVVVRDHRGGYNGYDRGGYNGYDRGGYNRYDRGGYRGGYNGRVVVHNAPRYHGVVRRPIFVARPVMDRRYFSYYQRPSLIVENYSAMPGYFWVPGTWTWSGLRVDLAAGSLPAGPELHRPRLRRVRRLLTRRLLTNRCPPPGNRRGGFVVCMCV